MQEDPFNAPISIPSRTRYKISHLDMQHPCILLIHYQYQHKSNLQVMYTAVGGGGGGNSLTFAAEVLMSRNFLRPPNNQLSNFDEKLNTKKMAQTMTQ